jgi:hypothetical protein
MRLQKYDVTLQYVPGKLLHLQDMLSRAYLEATDDFIRDIDPIETVVMLSEINNVSDVTLQQVTEESLKDPSMMFLKEYIQNGLPEDRALTDESVQPFRQFADELECIEDILYRGNRVIVPKCMRRQMLEKIHSAHMGADSCIRRARQSVYWPNMTSDIRDYVGRCSTCSQYSTKQPYEPLQSHDVPSLPWNKVGLDTFHDGSHEYLITVDYFSNFFEVDRLELATSSEMIRMPLREAWHSSNCSF